MKDLILQTDRLHLKAITPERIHHLFNTLSKAQLIDYFGVDEQGFEHLLERHEKGMETHRLSLFYFLMIHKQTGKTIGDCGFHTWNLTHRRAEIFYGMRNENDKRKGFTKEALKAVLDFGFNQLDLNRVEAYVADYNEPSVRLLKHFGFTKEATARGHYLVDGVFEDSDFYALLKSEWEG